MSAIENPQNLLLEEEDKEIDEILLQLDSSLSQLSSILNEDNTSYDNFVKEKKDEIEVKNELLHSLENFLNIKINSTSTNEQSQSLIKIQSSSYQYDLLFDESFKLLSINSSSNDHFLIEQIQQLPSLFNSILTSLSSSSSSKDAFHFLFSTIEKLSFSITYINHDIIELKKKCLIKNIPLNFNTKNKNSLSSSSQPILQGSRIKITLPSGLSLTVAYSIYYGSLLSYVKLEELSNLLISLTSLSLNDYDSSSLFSLTSTPNMKYSSKLKEIQQDIQQELIQSVLEDDTNNNNNNEYNKGSFQHLLAILAKKESLCLSARAD